MEYEQGKQQEIKDNLLIMNPLSILQSFPDGIAIFGRDLKLLFANSAFGEILRVSAQAITDKSVQEVFHLTPEVSRIIEDFFQNGVGYVNHDFTIVASENEKLPVGLTVSRIDLGLKESGACVIVRSNVARKELHNEIEKGEKMATLSMMAAGLGHEIKNPLSGIMGAAQLIAMEKKDPSEYCQMIIKETERINSLVNELLDLGSRKKPRTAKVNIHKVLDETLSLQEALLERKKIRITRDYDPSLPPLKADPDRLKQLFLNLTKNAVEVMKKGGTLRIKTRTSLDPAPTFSKQKRKGMISIEIIDSGRGIDPKVARHLFTPFNTSKRYGTGLGLVISLKIVKDHGGTLTLENRVGTPGAIARAILPIY